VLTPVADTHRGRLKKRFFNEIRALRPAGWN
jgi:hypothetical protein